MITTKKKGWEAAIISAFNSYEIQKKSDFLFYPASWRKVKPIKLKISFPIQAENEIIKNRFRLLGYLSDRLIIECSRDTHYFIPAFKYVENYKSRVDIPAPKILTISGIFEEI